MPFPQIGHNSDQFPCPCPCHFHGKAVYRAAPGFAQVCLIRVYPTKSLLVVIGVWEALEMDTNMEMHTKHFPIIWLYITLNPKATGGGPNGLTLKFE